MTKYFTDHEVKVCSRASLYQISLTYHDCEDFFVDPSITDGINWWQEGMPLSNILYAVRRPHPILQESLNDNWSLYSISLWLSQQRELPAKIHFLHLDDHQDLMSPRLAYKKEILTDTITQKPFYIKNPDSVKSSILSGAVGIGSFLVPLLEAVKKVEIHHISYVEYPYSLYAINLETKADEIRGEAFKRLTSTLTPISHEMLEGQKHLYYVESDIDAILKRLSQSSEHVLLHIDLDYFNNRYNRDSDWQEYQRVHDLSWEIIEDRISYFLSCLESYAIVPRIVNIAVAFSPGFFPAEFWKPSSALIKKWVDEKFKS